MRKPKDAIESAARDSWMHGDAATAMVLLRDHGYEQGAREDFLRKVVGVTETALFSVEIHRDYYLEWLTAQDKAAVSMCATVGCGSVATEHISFDWRGQGETVTEDVCTSCADGYQRRPVLVNFSRQPIAA